MCDYSLHHVASRPAKVGDKLVTTQFNNSITRGFAAVGEPNVAVCLLPGTEVAFEKEIEFERGFAILLSLRWEREKAMGDKVARFRQVNADKPNVHHDALEFPNGESAWIVRGSRGPSICGRKQSFRRHGRPGSGARCHHPSAWCHSRQSSLLHRTQMMAARLRRLTSQGAKLATLRSWYRAAVSAWHVKFRPAIGLDIAYRLCR